MAYDGSIKIDTKVDTSGLATGVDKMKSIATKGVAALTTTFTAVSGAIVAGGTAATHVGSDFEAAMSKVSAISGATGKDLTALTDKAKEMGASTKFSASESASALQYMAMAGWDTSDMLSGISGIMSLAAADGLDLAATSDIVTDALTAFGLKASDSSHFADVLAKASSSANTNVSMLGESLKYVAPLAGAMGYSAEDVSVALGLMANASIKGSMAGTSLKTALSNLASPTKQMQEIMDKYKLSITDATGKALPLSVVMKQLRERFRGVSEAEQTAAASTLFGKEAMSGMLAIINASEEDFNNLTSNINNADGAAQLMAETMENNLQGQITILKSAIEGLGIEIYEGMSTPLQDAAVEAQKYVNRLTSAFKDGGLTGLIEEAGNIFGDLAVKATEAAPKMVDAAISFIKSFAHGIATNANKLMNSAKTIVTTIVNNLVKLLPKDVQKPVMETIKNIQKSFESGGLRSAINTVKTVIQNLGKAINNVAKVVLPPLSKAVDFLAGKMNVLLPAATGVYVAYKSFGIIKTVTALIQSSTSAVSASTLAHAAETGTISLKQIAVGALTGQIGLATAAQYAWNLAMSMNPIGAVIIAVSGLAAGVGALSLTMGEAENTTKRLDQAQANLDETNEKLGSTYEEIGDKFSDFMNKIDSSDSILDGFNENILISDEKKQAIHDNMDAVQKEITQVCKTAADERRELTGGEIQRLNELFQTMHKLAEQELAIEKSKQEVAVTAAEDLASASNISLAEYTERSASVAKTAEETRASVISKAEEQYYEELALLKERAKNQSDYSDEQYERERKAAQKSYEAAVEEANKVAGDTLAILEKGYYDRSNALKTGTAGLQDLHRSEKIEASKHTSILKKIESDYTAKINEIKSKGMSDRRMETEVSKAQSEKDQAIEKEKARNIEQIERIHNKQKELLNNESYQEELVAFLNLETLYESYTGKMGTHSKEIVKAVKDPMNGLPEKTQKAFQDAVQGAINGLESKKESLIWKARELKDSFIAVFTKGFQENSPSKLFQKIFGYTVEGGTIGLDKEAPSLYKTADKIGKSFTKKMKNSVSMDSLIARMREGVMAGKELLTETLTTRMLHNVNILNNDDEKKVVLKGDIPIRMDIDGRELAVATVPYISEELCWSNYM